jgi:hypothetical protein
MSSSDLSELNIPVLQCFVNACETYIQFTKEWPDLTAKETELKAFCEHIVTNKPYLQIKEQFDKLVAEKHQSMVMGIMIKGGNGNNNEPGDFFLPGNKASITITGVERQYNFIFADLCGSCLTKCQKRKKNDVKKEPAAVLMYMIHMISNVIRLSVINSDLPDRIKNSICQNTSKDTIERPYSDSKLAHVLTVGAKLAAHPTIRSFLDPHIGEGSCEKIAAGLGNFDPSVLLNQNISGPLTEAVGKADVDGIIEHGKKFVVSVIGDIREGTDMTDPNEQC